MKEIPSGLASHLAGHATTLAKCWLVTRSDGTVLGFTDHDCPLDVEGITCRAENALEASTLVAGTGFGTGGGDLSGALSALALSDDDLEAGLWDGAQVAMYLVNWQDTSQKLLVRRARIGEVSRSGEAFQAELRGLAHLLDQRQGRVFSRNCDADLGDARCKVDLEDPAYCVTAQVVASPEPAVLHVSGAGSFAADWFTGGRLTVLDGAQAGFTSEIASHQVYQSGVTISLWQAPPKPLQDMVQVKLTAGCDRRSETCRSKFANFLNYQGFPHMPGTDFVLSYPTRNTGENDGAPRTA